MLPYKFRISKFSNFESSGYNYKWLFDKFSIIKLPKNPKFSSSIPVIFFSDKSKVTTSEGSSVFAIFNIKKPFKDFYLYFSSGIYGGLLFTIKGFLEWTALGFKIFGLKLSIKVYLYNGITVLFIVIILNKFYYKYIKLIKIIGIYINNGIINFLYLKTIWRLLLVANLKFKII